MNPKGGEGFSKVRIHIIFVTGDFSYRAFKCFGMRPQDFSLTVLQDPKESQDFDNRLPLDHVLRSFGWSPRVLITGITMPGAHDIFKLAYTQQVILVSHELLSMGE